MNLSTLYLLASFSCVAVTAAHPQSPAQPGSANDPGAAAQPDPLAPWRERAARAETWLRARAASTEEAAKHAMARARQELLGVEGAVVEPTLAIAGRAESADAAPGAVQWETIANDAATMPRRPGASVVVLVHGLDEPGTIWDELTPHLLDAGAIVIRFDYPNDQGVVASGKDLAAALRRLRGLGIGSVSIVAHSMGGLVSREALTSEDGYLGDGAATADLPAVERLIMCGTPNHGTPLAVMQPVAEAREQVYRHATGTSANGSGLIASSGDGLGEAGRDLREDSEFLKTLNARPLPLNVQCTTICGIMTPAGAGAYLRGEAAGRWAGLLGPERAAALATQAGAAVQTLGDGIVPAASTRLDGVDDHVEINADHRSMLKRWTILKKVDELRGIRTPPAEAIPVILDRLGLKPLPPDGSVDPTPRAE